MLNTSDTTIPPQCGMPYKIDNVMEIAAWSEYDGANNRIGKWTPAFPAMPSGPSFSSP